MKLVSPEEAVAGIRSGEQLYLQCAAATPSVLLDALVARAPELHDVSVVHLHCEGPGPHLAPEMAPHFRHRALFIGPNARAAVNEGRADYVPTFLSDVPRLFDSGMLPLDHVFVNATPPDAHGFCSLGTSVEAMHAAIRAAKNVIVQFNRGVPRTLGESFIHVDDIDLAVECDVPPYEVRPGPIGEVERRIGEFVADLIPDGATIQMGIGAIPAAVGAALARK
jgi:4-hydroxybutyrate CoA-transferase